MSNKAPDEIHLWYWVIPPDTYNPKRRKSTWRMTEEDARERYGDAAEKVEGTLEIRQSTPGGDHAGHLIGEGWAKK